MSLSLESTPGGPLSPVNSLAHYVAHGEQAHRSNDTRRRKGSQTIEVTPYTTYYASTPSNRLHRHAAMSLLLKTSEGRERTLRFLQNMLRLYVFLNSKRRSPISSHSAATAQPAPRRTTRLLLLVFLLSAFRKFRNLCELIAPFAPSGTNARLRVFAGTSDLATSSSSWKGSLSRSSQPSLTGTYSSESTSSSRWLWTERHAWAGVDPKEDEIKAAMPPASDEQSCLLRQRLEGLEVTLSLLDTISDGVALFAKLGVTLSLPYKLIQNRMRKHINRTKAVLRMQQGQSRGMFEKLSMRAELLADIFWLATTLVSLTHSEWERREVWKYGRRVRRLMREEEIIRERTERELELYVTDRKAEDTGEGLDDETSLEEQRILGNERRIQRIRDQRRTLRDLRGRLTWLWWDRLRLGADAVFALYDLFEWRPGSEAVRAVAGAISAGVGFSQIWSESSRHAKLAPRSRRPSVSM